jgi:MFS transporter, DHA1 family, multidrug resistance protein
MSEIPQLGRSVPYVLTFSIYIAIAAPTAVLDNFSVLVFFRFLQGFFGSPCLYVTFETHQKDVSN